MSESLPVDECPVSSRDSDFVFEDSDVEMDSPNGGNRKANLKITKSAEVFSSGHCFFLVSVILSINPSSSPDSR